MIGTLKEIAEILVIIIGAYGLLAFAGRRIVRWTSPFHRHRVRILAACSAAVLLGQVTEEVLGRESDAVDRSLLLALHARVPAAWDAVFEFLTVTASATFLMPAVAAGATLLLVTRRDRAAAQLMVTAAVASGVVYAAKTLVGRTRPALWDARWYWGSSFPSGHTLTAAAIATCVCVVAFRTRMSARGRTWLVAAATAWVVGVATSRLVLGVHWPTDVAAAACAGLLVGLGVDLAAGFVARGWARHTASPTRRTTAPVTGERHEP